MTDSKIYLITCEIECDRTKGKKIVIVSHGIGNNTLQNYCLPPEPLSEFKPKHDHNGAYIDAPAPA